MSAETGRLDDRLASSITPLITGLFTMGFVSWGGIELGWKYIVVLAVFVAFRVIQRLRIGGEGNE
jgi:hypothetical protein